MLNYFAKRGGVSFIIGGQWGSCGKGAAAAFVSQHCSFDIVTTNAGAQAGHTSTHNGVTKVVFHLPTYTLYQPAAAYLNAGSIIDPVGLERELDENPDIINRLAIHPNAAIITQACRDAEMRDDSAQTKIASTRKGVGEALSRKVLRSGILAKDEPRLKHWVRRLDLNEHMLRGAAVLAEVPQGHSLSLDGPFYPHTTSRNCTVMQAMSDAGIHPQFYHQSMMVIRTFPIRVGNINRATIDEIEQDSGLAHMPYEPPVQLGNSGPCFPDQRETSWGELGVKVEITTVTKRVRRVFTFSEQQVAEAIAQTRPAVIYLTFCDYLPNKEAVRTMVDRLRKMCGAAANYHDHGVEILTQWGPTTDDVIPAEGLWA